MNKDVNKKDKGTYYITTPIYYPNANPHIGHTYCSVASDAIARYKRKLGYDVFFLTGTDEHGQKIERAAETAGVSPKEYVDTIVANFKDLWKMMDISYDEYIRTTDDYHEAAVQKIFKQLYDQGDIYKGTYEGWYCTPCETFWLERQLVDGKCPNPDCLREVEKMSEESYFFRMSKYTDRLIAHIKDNPEFILPESRANEMMQNFLLPGLDDISVSRKGMKWGIPIEFDPEHTIYVWIDALSNYITALGYASEDDSLYQKFWPADVHIVGKEIIRFHTITWPTILMALGLPLPKQIFGHGWLLFDGQKMSKSRGNVVDPKMLVERYGVDPIRYFLLREVAFGQDGLFSNAALLQRMNSDLSNDLGNLLSRTVAMIEKYFDARIPNQYEIEDENDLHLKEVATSLTQKMQNSMDAYKMHDAIGEIWKLISAANKYIDLTTPWILAKDESKKDRLGGVLYNLAETLRIIAGALEPFLPTTCTRLLEQLGVSQNIISWESLSEFGVIVAGTKVVKGEALFPRMDIEKELEELENLGSSGQEEASATEEEKTPAKPEIKFDDFEKLDLRIGEVLSCEPVKGADRLLQFEVKMGNETRTILSGIRKWYGVSAELVGKKVVVVANLEPRKIRGVVSHGMLLSAASEDDEKLSLLSVLGEAEDGWQVS